MTKEDKKIRIAGYARVSTDIQAEKGESLKVQEEEIKRYAAALGYHLAHIYMDKGISGAKKERPELEKLRQDAKEGKFDKVVFTKLSRFGRNTSNLLELFKEFEDDYKVPLICIKENFDTSTSSGRLLRTVLAAIAEFERDTIRTQMKEGKLNRLKRAETFIGKVPYGYKFNKEKKVMEIIEEEAKIYHEIVDMFLNQNLSINDIVLNLLRRGLKSPSGKRWTSITVSYILKNPTYKGEYFANRYEYDMNNRIYEKDEDGRRVAKEKPEEEWIKFPYPSLIDEYKWSAIQQKIQFNTIKPKNEKFPDLFLAAGLMKCGICGSKVSIKNGVTTKKGTTPHWYACHWAKSISAKALELGNRERCSLPSIHMEDVDDHLWARMVNLLTYPETALKQAIAGKTNMDELLTEKQRVESELKSNERKMKKLLNELLNDFSGEEVRKQLKIMAKEAGDHVQELKIRLAELQRELSTAEMDKEVMKGLKLSKFRKEIKKCLHNLPGKEKKHLTRILVSPETGGAITLRLITEGDRQLDDKVFKEGKIKASDTVEGKVIADFNVKIRGEKIIGAYEYLKNKGFLSDNISYSWSAVSSRASSFPTLAGLS